MNGMISEFVPFDEKHIPVDSFAVNEAKDPGSTLTELLETIPMKGEVTRSLNLSSPYGIRIDDGQPRFYLVTHGQCRLEIQDIQHSLLLAPGDLVVVTRGQKHSLRNSPTDSLLPLSQFLASSTKDKINSSSTSTNSTSLVFGSFLFDRQGYRTFLASLPSLIHIRVDDRKTLPGLDDLLRIIIRESETDQPGSWTIINQLVHVLFIQIIRFCVTTMPRSQKSLLTCLMDPEIGPILRWMHHHPEMPWTVASLAEKAYMSRSVFAARFNSLVGQPPLHYLNECRMTRACALLRETPRGIREIALATGYSSEAAFSNAFKRWKGVSPGKYRKTDDRTVPETPET
jgi:AraC-like DNA-binding protein